MKTENILLIAGLGLAGFWLLGQRKTQVATVQKSENVGPTPSTVDSVLSILKGVIPGKTGGTPTTSTPTPAIAQNYNALASNIAAAGTAASGLISSIGGLFKSSPKPATPAPAPTAASSAPPPPATPAKPDVQIDWGAIYA